MANRSNILRPMKQVIKSVNMKHTQKEAIKSSGFAGLLDLKCTQFPCDLRDWLLNNFNPETKTLTLHDSKVIVSPEDVEHILGLLSRGPPVPTAGKTAKEIKVLFGGGKITTKQLKECLLKLSGGTDEFVVKFVLFMIGSFLCATSSMGVNRKYLHGLTDVSSIPKMNWSKLVLDCLCEGVKKTRGKPNKATDGCTLFLLLFYLEHMTPVSGAGPRVGVWGDKAIVSRWESLKALEINKKKNKDGVTGSVVKPKRTLIQDEHGCKNLREAVDKNTNHFKAWSPGVMERAKEVQANLSREFPSFIKVMRGSTVSPPFHMSFPSKLSAQHIQRRDRIVVLEVASGKKYPIKLLSLKLVFTDGWREFSIAEKLLEDDILVCHLVSPVKFKVFIVRASGTDTMDKSVIKIDDFVAEKEPEKNRTWISTYKKRPRLVKQSIRG